MAARVELGVWNDHVCPFCHLGPPELDRSRERFGDAVAIRWRAFESRPDPAPTLDPDGGYLHRVWGEAVHPMAAARGVALRPPPMQPRSRLAHETATFARERGRFDAVHEGPFRAFRRDGRDLADARCPGAWRRTPGSTPTRSAPRWPKADTPPGCWRKRIRRGGWASPACGHGGRTRRRGGARPGERRATRRSARTGRAPLRVNAGAGARGSGGARVGARGRQAASNHSTSPSSRS